MLTSAGHASLPLVLALVLRASAAARTLPWAEHPAAATAVLSLGLGLLLLSLPYHY